MHLCLVAPEFPPQIGGMETYAKQLSGALSGFAELTLITGQNSLDAHKNTLLFSGEKLSEDLHNLKPGMIHLNNAGLCGILSWDKIDKIPVIVTAHGKDFMQPWICNSRKKVITGLNSSSLVIAVSSFVKEKLYALGIKKKVVVISHGVDTSHFIPSKEISDGNNNRVRARLITVSRIHPKKNIELVLKAVSKLKERIDVKYDIIGPIVDKAYYRSLSALIKYLRIEKEVSFLGPKSYQELPSHYNSAGIYVMPSAPIGNLDIETFGISFLEAAACGLPCIGPKIGGSSDFIKEGINGFMVSHDDHRSLVEKITLLSNDLELYGKLSRSARQSALDFSIDRMITKTIGAYGPFLKMNRKAISQNNSP